jgi:hypothetical protein
MIFLFLTMGGENTVELISLQNWKSGGRALLPVYQAGGEFPVTVSPVRPELQFPPHSGNRQFSSTTSECLRIQVIIRGG